MRYKKNFRRGIEQVQEVGSSKKKAVCFLENDSEKILE